MSEKHPSSVLPRCDWAELEAADRRYWADEYARAGSDSAVRASTALWQHMRSVRAEWPTPADRDADLRHHVEFRRLLARVASVTSR